MAEILHPITPDSLVVIHRQAIDILVSSGNGDATLLYLCLMDKQNSSALHWAPARVETAREELIRIGLIAQDTPVYPPSPSEIKQGSTLPRNKNNYTSEDIIAALQTQERFHDLIPQVEKRLGKILSVADLKVLYCIYNLSLPSEVILTITGWCIEQNNKHRRYCKPTVTQIYREAERWKDAGITTMDAANTYLEKFSYLTHRETEILQLLFGQARRPMDWEAEYLQIWIEREFSDELLTLAYERTIFQIQNFKWSYMNGILNRWYDAGLATLEQVEASEKDHRTDHRSSVVHVSQAPGPRNSEHSVTVEDIDRMIREIDQLST